GPSIRRFAGWLPRDTPTATRPARRPVGSPALPRPESWVQFPSTVAHSADILLLCSSRISPPLCTLHDKRDQQGTVRGELRHRARQCSGTVKTNCEIMSHPPAAWPWVRAEVASRLNYAPDRR